MKRNLLKPTSQLKECMSFIYAERSSKAGTSISNLLRKKLQNCKDVCDHNFNLLKKNM